MPYYSVVTTKDKLASLIDKALAGEEVIITRHGKPIVEFRPVQERSRSIGTREESRGALRERRERPPSIDIDSADRISEMRDEDAHYVRDLIRRDQERAEKIEAMQRLVTEGFESGVSDRSFDEILAHARREAGVGGGDDDLSA